VGRYSEETASSRIRLHYRIFAVLGRSAKLRDVFRIGFVWPKSTAAGGSKRPRSAYRGWIRLAQGLIEGAVVWCTGKRRDRQSFTVEIGRLASAALDGDGRVLSNGHPGGRPCSNVVMETAEFVSYTRNVVKRH
jgi:hypothetical protein